MSHFLHSPLSNLHESHETCQRRVAHVSTQIQMLYFSTIEAIFGLDFVVTL